MAEEIKTFLDIQNAIIRRAKLKDNDSVRDSLKEKINTVYQRVAFEKPYRWCGKTLPLLLRAKYTTGTVSVTNGSYQVTGAGTSWVKITHQNRKIKIGSVTYPFKILRVVEDTQVITLDAPYTGATNTAATYTIFKDEYGLFPDLQDIRQLRIPGLSRKRQPIPCGPRTLDERRDSSPFATGTPTKYTINGFEHYREQTWATFRIDTDFWENDVDSQPKEKKLIIHPGILNEDKIASIRYTRMVSPMSADTDEPLIPYENRSVLVWGVLVDHFLVNRDIQTKSLWEGFYREEKMKMAGDIETTDDELQLIYDRRGVNRDSSSLDNDERYLYD